MICVSVSILNLSIDDSILYKQGIVAWIDERFNLLCMLYSFFCVGCNLKSLFILIFIAGGSRYQFQSNHQGHINIISVILHSINTYVEILITLIFISNSNSCIHAN